MSPEAQKQEGTFGTLGLIRGKSLLHHPDSQGQELPRGGLGLRQHHLLGGLGEVILVRDHLPQGRHLMAGAQGSPWDWGQTGCSERPRGAGPAQGTCPRITPGEFPVWSPAQNSGLLFQPHPQRSPTRSGVGGARGGLVGPTREDGGCGAGGGWSCREETGPAGHAPAGRCTE